MGIESTSPRDDTVTEGQATDSETLGGLVLGTDAKDVARIIHVGSEGELSPKLTYELIMQVNELNDKLTKVLMHLGVITGLEE